MATVETPEDRKVVVKEMSWDPITRIVGSLGIHTEIDFSNQVVNKCYSTSMVFRGFDIFMRGIDPRDAHFITSRICGICGDNHCTTSCLNQNMAYGVHVPPLGDYAFNLAELADYMFDHAIFNDCMCNVDFCEQMVKDTNPSLLQTAEQTSAPNVDVHGYRTIADIMRALNPFTGDFYLETLQVARYTREMYCLFGGRHTHPSTIMPGGCSAHITHQTLTDYYVRLMRYMDYAKRTVKMHDDLYDFFLQELPGYDMVGYRDTNLVCWGAFDDPEAASGQLYNYRHMTDWGRKRFVTPGIAINGELVTTDLVEINLMIRILLGSSYFDDWADTQPQLVTQDPLGNPVDKRHPWNKVTLPKPQKRDFADKYSWVVSPRIYDKRTDTHVCCDTGGGPFARQWVTAKAGLVDIGYVKATGDGIQMVLPKGHSMPEMELEWRVPEKSNAIERDRARSYHQAYSAAVALYNLDKAFKEVRAGRTKSHAAVTVPNEAISVGFHEAARGVLSHHMVIRDGKVANYQPYPPTPWNASSRDTYGTPGPYEDAVQNTPIFEENGPENFKGVDIMRAVRSFDPCLPCGVHMYTGRGKVRKVMHTPTALT
jgi:hydrogenase large subunit